MFTFDAFVGWPTAGVVPPVEYVDDHPRQPDDRRGQFIQTFSGRRFWPMDPRSEEVAIEDIAHALGMQCRYAGHCLRFYSVAEHSIHVAAWLEQHCGQETALYGLLHDASEAYLVDVPRPVKPLLTGYKDAEAAVMREAWEAFGLLPIPPRSVHEADTRILADEIAQNMKPMDWHAKHSDGLGITLQFWSPEEAEDRFLEMFARLMIERGNMRRTA